MNPKHHTHIFATLALVTALLVALPARAQAEPVKRCPKYEHLLRRADLPVRTFSRIMWRESRCQPRAIGWNYKPGKSHRDCVLSPANTYRKCKAVRSYDSGLLQINSSWVTVTAQVCKSRWGDMTVLLEPRCNIAVARYLYNNGGVDHWAASGTP